MIDEVKEKLLTKGMELLQSPAVAKLMESEKVQKGQGNTFVLHNARVTSCVYDLPHTHYHLKAKRVEIHETEMTDQGVMKMRPVEDGLALPAGETVTLKPGGKHIMVMGLDGELAKGATLPLTLDFEVAGEVEVAVPVGMGPSAAGDDAGASGGADHSHH